jgi:hypothetical protein
MARGRRRHGAHPPRGRRWWHAAVAALVAAAAVLVVHNAWTPSGSDGVGTTNRDRITEALPSGSRAPAPPTPSASSSRSTKPSASPSATANTRTKPKASAEASAKATRRPATGSGTSGRAQPQPTTAPAGKRLITVVNRTHQTVWAVVTNTAVYPVSSSGCYQGRCTTEVTDTSAPTGPSAPRTTPDPPTVPSPLKSRGQADASARHQTVMAPHPPNAQCPMPNAAKVCGQRTSMRE